VLNSLDQYVNDNNFSNRSQAIRFLVEKYTAEQKWLCNHVVAGTVIIIYDKNQTDIHAKINQALLDYHDTVLNNSQFYINQQTCLNVTTVTGTAHRLTELADHLVTIKGIKHGKLLMSRAD
jgi:CopG family nickel-responsive transcriptional regulator